MCIMSGSNSSILEWAPKDVEIWLAKEGFGVDVIDIVVSRNKLNGKCLLALNERDFSIDPLSGLALRDRKLLYLAIRNLQRENQNILVELGLVDSPSVSLYSHVHYNKQENSDYAESERSPAGSEDGQPAKLKPEIFKAFVSFCYFTAVTWITAFVMVIVHDRVPDMKKYPPLPDIFLDNVPHIPWAFDMCEVTGTFLFTIWLVVLLFHKHR